MDVESDLWPLFRGVAHDSTSWHALLIALEPVLLAIARRQPVGRLRAHEDTPREIATRVFARLRANDHAAIRQLCALDPPPRLEAWLRVIVRRSAIDHMREAPEYQRAAERWISLATLVSGAPAPGLDSLAEKRALVLSTVREMVARTAAEVAARGDDAIAHLALAWRIDRIHVRRVATHGERLLRVLLAILEGHAQTAVAEQLALTRREVELSVRYLEDMLHARFAEPAP